MASPPRVRFLWFDPLMKLGARTHLEMADIWCLAPRDTCATVHADFERHWSAERRRAAAAGQPPTLTRAAMSYSRRHWMVAIAPGGEINFAPHCIFS
jgi:hypothetical protein